MAQADRGLRPRPDRLGAEGLEAGRGPARRRARPAGRAAAVLVEPGGVDALVAGIRRAVEMPRAEREALGREARRLVLESFTWDRNVAAVLERLRDGSARRETSPRGRPEAPMRVQDAGVLGARPRRSRRGLWCLATAARASRRGGCRSTTSADAWYTLATLRAAHDGHLTPLGRIDGPRARRARRRELERLPAPAQAAVRARRPPRAGHRALPGRQPARPARAAVLAALSLPGGEPSTSGRGPSGPSPAPAPSRCRRSSSTARWPTSRSASTGRSRSRSWSSRWAFGRARDPAGIAPLLGRGGDRPSLRASTTSTTPRSSPSSWGSRVPRPVARAPLARAAALSPLALLAVLFAAGAGRQRQPARAARGRGPDRHRCCARTATSSATRSSRSSCCCRSARAASSLARGREGRTCGSALYRGEMGLGLSRPRRRRGAAGSRAGDGTGGLRRPRRPVPATALALAWILAYSVVGGLNGLLGLAGFVWLRATSRHSIWILALVLLWGVVAISRAALARRRRASVLAATRRGRPDARRPAPATDTGRRDPRGRRRASCPTPSFARSLEGRAARGRDAVPAPGRRLPGGAAHPRGLRLRAPPPLSAREAPALQLRLGQGTGARCLAAPGGGAGAGADGGRARAHGLHRASLVNRKAYPDGAQALREALAATGRLETWESPDRDFLFIRLRPARVRSLPTWSCRRRARARARDRRRLAAADRGTGARLAARRSPRRGRLRRAVASLRSGGGRGVTRPGCHRSSRC